jgi:beta-lactamase class A
VRNRTPFSALRLLSVFFLLCTVVLFVIQLARFSRVWGNFPSGLTIAGVPVGQLNRQQAAQRLLEIYSMPVEVIYNDGTTVATIQFNPSVIGFEMDTEAMLAAADQERTRQPFWRAFWENLWGGTVTPVNIPLRASFSENRLRIFLQEEIAKRYDQPASPAMPAVGTVNFTPGKEGTSLNVEQSILLIENALFSPTTRSLVLQLQHTNPSRPAFQNLDVLLRQTIDISGFDGVVGLYMLDLKSGQEIEFAYNQAESLPIPPSIAFTASSTIKIPIMISVFRRVGQNPDAETEKYLQFMITKSDNIATDWLMKKKLDPARGPLIVSEDMQALGLESTFLAGYFAAGSPILKLYKTPANQRTDVNTQPDPYNQTTPSEIGELLSDVYFCAQSGGGTLTAVFPEEITQGECQVMLDYLAQDKTGALIQEGVPDGTRVAHKHGWVTDASYIIHDMSDAAIVYTPGGDYVLAVYLYHPVQLVFDPSNKLVADLSRAVYNFYNLPTP